MTSAEPTFQKAVDDIKNFINEEFLRQKINLANLMALLYILGDAQSEDELIVLSRLFADKFPVLNEYLKGFDSKVKNKFEKNIEEVLRKIVVENPILAGQIAKKAMEQGMDLEKLKLAYPEMTKFI